MRILPLLLLLLLLLFPFFSISQIITTIAGNDIAGDSGDGGPASTAQLSRPTGILVDAIGNIYFSDAGNNRIRKIDVATGVISTFAGNGTPGSSGDGGLATSAQLNGPVEICTDHSGANLYIAESLNNIIRKVNFSTGIITTVAGDVSVAGYAGDGGPASAAILNSPNGVWVDDSENIYIGDAANELIRKINYTTGIINKISGSTTSESCVFGDGGPAINAFISTPASGCRDSYGNTYFVQYYLGSVRKIDQGTTIIHVIAGQCGASYSGDGGPATDAQLNSPRGIAIDPYNNLYVADEYNHRVRMINASTDIITTIAGNGGMSSFGDGGPATSACIIHPRGLCFDAMGNLYITSDHRIRKVSNVFDPSILSVTNQSKTSLNIYPNPSGGKFTLCQTGTKTKLAVRIYNRIGQQIFETLLDKQSQEIDITDRSPGVYILSAISESDSFSQKIIVNK